VTPARAVLHISSAPGGGVDRYLRDIAAGTPYPHIALHVGRTVDIVEDLARGAFWPVPADAARVADVIAATTALVHLHSVDARSRAWAQALRDRSALPLVTTLHDVSFAHPDAFIRLEPGVNAAWAREVASLLTASNAVIAPSAFIRDLAREAMPGVDPFVIAPGIPEAIITDQALPPSFLSRRPREVVAVVGAIGPHKGSALLEPIAQGLAAMNRALVVIGYTDTRLAPGWVAPGLFVHGPYIDAALPGLLAAYAPRVVLFPNRLAESFSYTLSEVWACGIPVIVPDEGALGERVRTRGGGWLLPPRFDAAAAIALLERVSGPAGGEEWRQVKSGIVPHSESVPDLDGMTRGVAAVYARFGIAPSALEPPDLSALQPLLAANLNGLVFREELVHLCEALANSTETARAASTEAQAQTQHARDVQAWADKLQRDVDEARAWAAKLEHDVATLTDQLAARDRDMQALTDAVAQLRAELARLAVPSAAFGMLPSLVQRILLRRVHRERG